MSDAKHPAETMALWVKINVRLYPRDRDEIVRALQTIPALEAERDNAHGETLEQARLLGMGAERELALIAERDLLRAEIARERESRKAAQVQLEATQEQRNRAALEARIAEGKRLGAKIETLQSALETLARLGNGDKYGNSDGNMIARAALQKALAMQATSAAIDVARGKK